MRCRPGWARSLPEAWTALAGRADLRCVILTGEGKHFQAGADLKERNGMSDETWAAQHKVFEAMARAQLAVPVPVIAAVNGAAMGGGCEMTLACDFAYASRDRPFRPAGGGPGHHAGPGRHPAAAPLRRASAGRSSSSPPAGRSPPRRLWSTASSTA